MAELKDAPVMTSTNIAETIAAAILDRIERDGALHLSSIADVVTREMAVLHSPAPFMGGSKSSPDANVPIGKLAPRSIDGRIPPCDPVDVNAVVGGDPNVAVGGISPDDIPSPADLVKAYEYTRDVLKHACSPSVCGPSLSGITNAGVMNAKAVYEKQMREHDERKHAAQVKANIEAYRDELRVARHLAMKAGREWL